MKAFTYRSIGLAQSAAVPTPSAWVWPTDRVVDWTTVGRSGGLSESTWTSAPVYDVTAAPYNADNTGSVDASGAIQDAIDAIKAAGVPAVLYLPAGTYAVVSSLIVRDIDNMLIKGDGATTIISVTSNIDVFLWDSYNAWIAVTSLSSGYTKGSNTLVVSSATGLTTNHYMSIAQTNPAWVSYVGYGSPATWVGLDGDETKAMTQCTKVTNIAGTTITVEDPCLLDFDVANNPVFMASVYRQNNAIKDLRIDYGGGSASPLEVLRIQDQANFLCKGVTINGIAGSAIYLSNTCHCTIHGNVVNGSTSASHGSDRSYGIFSFRTNSANLIENNHMIECRHSIIFEGGGSGCVVAYNYCELEHDHTANWVPGSLDTHGAHPYMNLWESNVTAKIAWDNTWGTASHQFAFRNYLRGITDDAARNQARICVDNESQSIDMMHVGNINGDLLTTFTYKESSTAVVQSLTHADLVHYRLGFDAPGDVGVAVDSDPVTTIYRHREYTKIDDTINDKVGEDLGLPASFYLSAAPAWWVGSWPPIGPDVSGYVTTLPAESL